MWCLWVNYALKSILGELVVRWCYKQYVIVNANSWPANSTSTSVINTLFCKLFSISFIFDATFQHKYVSERLRVVLGIVLWYFVSPLREERRYNVNNLSGLLVMFLHFLWGLCSVELIYRLEWVAPAASVLLPSGFIQHPERSWTYNL